MKILLVILCFFIPPLAVYLKTNDVKTTIINLILSFLFRVSSTPCTWCSRLDQVVLSFANGVPIL